MKKLLLLLGILPVLASGQIKYPVTAKGTTVDNYHGTTVPDPYRWLEDDRSDSTRDWVTRQNKVTFDYLGKIQYRKQWQDRLEDINNYAKYSSPFRQGTNFYFYKNDGLQNQSVLYRQKGLNGKPELLLDPNQFSAEGTTSLAAFSISKNGKYAVVGKSAGGSDWRTFFVMDLTTKKYLKDSLAWVKVSGAAWKGNGFFYSRYPAPEKGKELSTKNENHQVFYHVVGTSQDKDQLVYEDKANPQQFNSVFTDESERYVFLTSNDRGKGKEGNSLWYYDSKSTDKKFKPLIKDIGDFQYSFIEEVNGKFLLQTNEGARNRRIIQVDPLHPEKENWTTFIPEVEENMSSVTSAGSKLFVTYMKDVTSRVYVYDLGGKLEREVKLPGLGTVSGFGGEREDPFVFYTFTSITYPPTIFKYDIATGESSLFRKPEVKFDPEDYVTEQVFYPSKDGTQIPMFIVHKKGLELNGKNPAILYGYGGFNISSTPNFSSARIAWLEQGGVYCIANLRGGSEYGEKWHEAGMREKKQNVFDDFITAAEFLIAKGYTSPDYLAAQGGSNGGLLVGTVINQRPELFKVAIPQVGVMDMLRFHKFTIGWNWIAEYGSSDKPGDFKNLYSYSPIHNIKPGINYPATLVTTADHDDRVVPAHSFKYAATLQEFYQGNNPLLIRIDVNSGHGASNLKKSLETTADIYSFIFYNMGLKPEFKLTADGKKAF
ncbi:MAG TPA: prolyl oligopeptidase family serine peptidase [Chitinophagaceae bacterium]|nr:prolyl oligopeptidase family serine peptidase [Chitinophagaceae bacterium]HPH30777.1 prolyl oligopeptidase family serine peptidase [Chitinophagaceae bacterium]HPN58082.1 prolyl oligopeptidase family serine peptidase [Chitinophagaceae bacterium]